jgi:DNA-binding NarL/FixJ family response regulator
MCVNVLLADDAEVVRKAIRKLLSERKDIKVVGEAATFPEVLQKATELKPDVIVIDLHIPGGWFLDAISQRSQALGDIFCKQ